KSTVTRMAAKYRTRVTTPAGVLTCFEAVIEREVGKKPLVAQFGGFAIRRRKDAILVDQRPPLSYTKGSELLKRLQADACELCAGKLAGAVREGADGKGPAVPPRQPPTSLCESRGVRLPSATHPVLSPDGITGLRARATRLATAAGAAAKTAVLLLKVYPML